MSSGHLSTSDFFERLTELFGNDQKADPASVFLTQKRLIHGSSENAGVGSKTPDLDVQTPLPILMRATNGKENKSEKIKISTVVQPDDLASFYVRYADICKSGMQGLKKRDRSGRKKAKAKKRKGAEAEKAP